MNHELICPQCKQAFRDEEFCPRHFVRLVPSSVPKQAPPANTAVEEAEEAGATQERESKLAQFMSRLGLRRVADRAALANDAPLPPHGSSDQSQSPLPESVLEEGWQLAGPVQSNAAVDRWPVERPTESGSAVPGHFHRYRTGALTTDAIYRRLEERTTPQLARIWAHGTVDFGGARADYELVSLPKAGVGLDKWLADSTSSEQRAWYLLPMLVELLRQLAAASVSPLTFEPAQLVLTDDGELWLATAAALTDVVAANAYRPEFERSALLPHGWAAPELTHQSVSSANTAVFSLGQILAQAIWGQPCSVAELQTGAVPFQAIVDARLARVLMGCLWPRPSGRWTREDLFRAVTCASADIPATPPWDSLAPDASSTAFSFAGASFWRLEDLLATAVKPSHWREATSRIDAILDWAEGTAWAGQTKLMREAQARGCSADWVLAALTRVVRPDAPLTWHALDLSDDEAARSLAGLAQRALQGGQADVDAMRELFQADLRGAFAPVPPKP